MPKNSRKQISRSSKVRTTSAGELLKKPYGRVVFPEADGTFRSEIIEFPGCFAAGDTAGEALANLEHVAESWLEAMIARGQLIPEPIENAEFSGKLVVRLPKSLHKKAAHAAARDGVSLNQFIVSSIAERVGWFLTPPAVAFRPIQGMTDPTMHMARFEVPRTFVRLVSADPQ